MVFSTPNERTPAAFYSFDQPYDPGLFHTDIGKDHPFSSATNYFNLLTEIKDRFYLVVTENKFTRRDPDTNALLVKVKESSQYGEKIVTSNSKLNDTILKRVRPKKCYGTAFIYGGEILLSAGHVIRDAIKTSNAGNVDPFLLTDSDQLTELPIRKEFVVPDFAFQHLRFIPWDKPEIRNGFALIDDSSILYPHRIWIEDTNYIIGNDWTLITLENPTKLPALHVQDTSEDLNPKMDNKSFVSVGFPLSSALHFSHNETLHLINSNGYIGYTSFLDTLDGCSGGGLFQFFDQKLQLIGLISGEPSTNHFDTEEKMIDISKVVAPIGPKNIFSPICAEKINHAIQKLK